MNLLIVYGSTDGHTRKIADFLHCEAIQKGHTAVVEAASARSIAPHDFDATIVASSIHAGQYSSEAVGYVMQHAQVLNFQPSAFVSVGLSITRNDAQALNDLEKTTHSFFALTKWNPLVTEQVAGALLYTQYGFLKKMFVKSIMKKTGGDTDTSRDFVYTNWESLKLFLEHFIRESEVIAIS